MKRKKIDRGPRLPVPYSRGTRPTYDLPAESVDHMRRLTLIKDAVAVRYRRIDLLTARYKAWGGDPKSARKHYTAKLGDPKKAAERLEFPTLRSTAGRTTPRGVEKGSGTP